MRIETNLDSDKVYAIEKHYLEAREKHPYFCDGITGGDVYGLVSENSHKWSYHGQHEYYSSELRLRRDEVLHRSKNRTLKAERVLACEYHEMLEAYARRDTAAAVEECYDAIAVLLRVVDVLEGRQELGRPKESEVS